MFLKTGAVLSRRILVVLVVAILDNEVLYVSFSINIKVRRVGGGYGSKISRSALVSTACALAAHKLHRPVRFVFNLETNMAAIGKRYSAAFDYEVSVGETTS
jgi:xanthine dehydrogenase molybdopterin-binding subunit B